MRRTRYQIPFLLIAFCLSSSTSYPEIKAQEGRNIGPDEQLRKLGFIVNEQGLASALADRRNNIRTLAAFELTVHPNRNLLPLLREVIAKEKDPLTKVHLAVCEISMGSEGGKIVLRDSAYNDAVPGHARALAIRNLINLNRDHEGPLVASIVPSLLMDNSQQVRIDALFLVPQIFRFLSGAEADTLKGLIRNEFLDEDVGVRLAASQTAVEISDVGSIPMLTVAIALKGGSTTEQMTQSLVRLKTIAKEVGHGN